MISKRLNRLLSHSLFKYSLRCGFFHTFVTAPNEMPTSLKFLEVQLWEKWSLFGQNKKRIRINHSDSLQIYSWKWVDESKINWWMCLIENYFHIEHFGSKHNFAFLKWIFSLDYKNSIELRSVALNVFLKSYLCYQFNHIACVSQYGLN